MVDDATPEATIIEAERRTCVRHLVGPCDEGLGRGVFQEQTWAQIAADLVLRISTVQTRVRRAVADLEARYAGGVPPRCSSRPADPAPQACPRLHRSRE